MLVRCKAWLDASIFLEPGDGFSDLRVALGARLYEMRDDQFNRLRDYSVDAILPSGLVRFAGVGSQSRQFSPGYSRRRRHQLIRGLSALTIWARCQMPSNV